MIDASQAWQRIKGRWATLRHEPCLFLHASGIGSEGDEQALAAFGLWCEAHPGWACRIGLSSRWLLHSVSTTEMTHPAALAHATRQWAFYLDLDEAALMRDWLIRQVIVGDTVLLCASPTSLMNGLKAHAKAHGVQLNWVGPWWAQGLQACMSDMAAKPDRAEGLWTLHLVEPEQVTHVEVLKRAGRQASLQRLWADRAMPQDSASQSCRVVLNHPDPEDVALVWDQEALRPLLQGADASWRFAA